MTYILVFLSGFAALIYQVLWMKQLGILFGNTSHAAAATLAAFFAGLASGSWFWGRRSARTKNPLKLYAILELGIGVTALLYFGILAIYFKIYPHLYQSIESHNLLLVVKFLLALLLIFPPACFMGGTIPVIGQHVIRHSDRFGTLSALLYGVNTIGAALGAGLAGFYLPVWLGFKLTCTMAIGTTGFIATIAYVMSRSTPETDPSADGVKTPDKPASDEPPSAATSTTASGLLPGTWAVPMVCFVSGFGVLALEVLWTRMFAQVLENSVYTFAAILVIVLVCLAAGSFTSSFLARLPLPPMLTLSILVLIGGLIISVTPFVFMQQTDSLQIISLKGSWGEYVTLIFKKGAITIAPPAFLLATIFPYLMKVEEKSTVSAGKTLGRLATINTVGAILGALLCGFVLISNFGMWRTMRLIAIVYLVAGLILPFTREIKYFLVKGACILLIILQFNLLNPATLPIVSKDNNRPDETILKTWEGSDCTVAVVETGTSRSIKINSHYGLGSTGAYFQERMQSDIPLFMSPDTESIFFLGMGTGITAGSSLNPHFPNVKRVITCELVPDVITAAREYFTDIDGYDPTNGLFTDPRSTVLAEDGRHYLMATDETFDLVNGDLFVPFRSGAGSLYTLEHFESVKARLNDGGLFVQWLPLYQVTETEFHIISRTLLEVFDQVSLWRSNFQPSEEVVALVGHKGSNPLPGSDIDNRRDKFIAVYGKTHHDLDNLQLPLEPKTVLFFYGGNLSASRELFMGYPLNTDDKPVIEYLAPRNYRSDMEGKIPWFVGPRIMRLIESLQETCPPDKDPLLVNRTPANRKLPLAATAYHRARLWRMIGDTDKWRHYWQTFLSYWLFKPEQPQGDSNRE